jgi:hypothetical protein
MTTGVDGKPLGVIGIGTHREVRQQYGRWLIPVYVNFPPAEVALASLWNFLQDWEPPDPKAGNDSTVELEP